MERETWQIIERAKVVCKLVSGKHMRVESIKIGDLVLLVGALIDLLESHEERLNKEFGL